jgi:hypothetical protein
MFGQALRYKPEGHRFDSQCLIENFYLRNPSGRTMAPGSTKRLTEMTKGKGKGKQSHYLLTYSMEQGPS